MIAFAPFKFNILFIRVDFPEPDGPAKIIFRCFTNLFFLAFSDNIFLTSLNSIPSYFSFSVIKFIKLRVSSVKKVLFGINLELFDMGFASFDF